MISSKTIVTTIEIYYQKDPYVIRIDHLIRELSEILKIHPESVVSRITVDRNDSSVMIETEATFTDLNQ